MRTYVYNGYMLFANISYFFVLRETETETKSKYNERFARQTLSMMFG